MTVNADIRSLVAFSAGDHALGSSLKEAGCTVTSGVLSFDTTVAHRWSPLGQSNVFSPTPPAGYTNLACGFMFVLQRSGTPGATHTIMQCWGDGTAYSADAIKITEDTSGVWSFIVAGVRLGTYTPSVSTDYHIMFYVTNMKVGTPDKSQWNAGDLLWATVVIDKTVLFNESITATSIGGPGGNPMLGVPVFGESAGIGGSGVFKVSHFLSFYSDRANPLGKVTAAQWTWRLGVTPPTGYDDATKSTGTDGAAVVDEVPPGGSGTTDGDYYDLTNGASETQQVNALAQNILSAGDVLYAVINKVWERTATTGKISGIGAALHDGTNFAQKGGAALTGPTSYAETTFGNAGCAIWSTAPDAALWSAKANAYLNGCYAGTYAPGTNSSANNRMDAIIIETAIVKSGDAISALADPVTTQVFVGEPTLMGTSAAII